MSSETSRLGKDRVNGHDATDGGGVSCNGAAQKRIETSYRKGTDDLKEWTKKLATVEPYMDYIDEEPTTAKHFRKALEQFVEVATRVATKVAE